MLIRTLALVVLSCFALACEEIPEDPCVPILRDPNPRLNVGSLSEIDFATTVQQQLQDDTRRRLCQGTMLQDPTPGLLPPLGSPGLPDVPASPTGCQLRHPDLVDLGPAPAFLPEVTGGLAVPFPAPAQITAIANTPGIAGGEGCLFDGVRVFNVEPGRLPILILNPNPPGQILVPSATVTAVDSKLAEGCRLKSLMDTTGEESICLSSTFVVWAYNESREPTTSVPVPGGDPIQLPPASRDFASTQAVLTIERPSRVALGLF